MAALTTWEVQASFIKEQYDTAVANKDVDAIVPPEIHEEETQKKKELISIQTINKYMVLVMKKSLAWAVSSIGVKMSTDWVVDFLASMQGLEMPPSGEKLILRKLDLILGKLDEIEAGQKEVVKAISRQAQLEEVKKVRSLNLSACILQCNFRRGLTISIGQKCHLVNLEGDQQGN